MTVYCVGLISINDRERYGAYEQGFMEIFRRYGGTLLAVDEKPVVQEGIWPHTRTVLASFPDAAMFDAWFGSADYQALAKHRQAASIGSIALINGLPSPPG